MAAKELTLEALPQMKKNDYKKLFKKIITWKKAKAVIILDDYKLDGKKSSILIPFKKAAEMQKEFKQARQEAVLVKPNKMASALFELNKAADGTPLAILTLKKCSINPQKIMDKIAPAFESIGVKLEIKGAVEDGSAEVETTEEEPILAIPTTEPSLSLADQIKNASAAVSDFKNGILPAYQNGELSEDAYQMGIEVEQRLQLFVEGFPSQSPENQAKYEKIKAAAEQILPQLEQIMAALSGDDPKAALEMTYKQLKSMAKGIEKQTKKIKKTVVKNIKKSRSTDRDLEIVDQCLEQIQDFEDLYEESDDRIKEKLTKHADRIQNKVKAQMQQLFDKVMEVAPMRQDHREEDEAFNARMEEVKDEVKAIKAEIEQIELELAKEKQEPLPAGDDFLSILSF
jgi:hypothetical protein